MDAEVHSFWDGFDDPAGPRPSLPGDTDVRGMAGPATMQTARLARAQAGLGGPARDPSPPGYPGISGLAEGLGLK